MATAFGKNNATVTIFVPPIITPTPSSSLMPSSEDGIFIKGSVLFTLIFSLLGALTFFGNAMVCYAYFKVKSLRTLTNKLVISTSISGILISVLFVPFFVVLDDLILSVSTDFMPFSSFLSSFLGFSMLFNIGALTWERHIAVFRSLEYRSVVTNRRVNWALVAVWIIPLLLSTLPTIFPHVIKNKTHLFLCFKIYQAFLSCVLSIIILAFFVVYFRVWRVSLCHLAFDRKQRHLASQVKGIRSLKLGKLGQKWSCFKLFSSNVQQTPVRHNSNEEKNAKDVTPPCYEMQELSPNFSNASSRYNSMSDCSDFASDLKRRLSSITVERLSNYSVTLNGVDLIEAELSTVERLKRNVVQVDSPRKLSVDWIPRHTKTSNAPKNRRYSAPVRKTTMSIDFLHPRRSSVTVKHGDEYGNKRQSPVSDSYTEISISHESTPAQSPDSMHGSRTRVSFAHSELRSERKRKTSNARRIQIKGIIKNHDGRSRRVNRAPKRSRTVSDAGQHRPFLSKSYSLPVNPIIEKFFSKHNNNKEWKPSSLNVSQECLQEEGNTIQTPASDEPYQFPLSSPETRKKIFMRNSHQLKNGTTQFLSCSLTSSMDNVAASQKTTPLSKRSIQSLESSSPVRLLRSKRLTNSLTSKGETGHHQQQTNSGENLPASVRRAMYRLRNLGGVFTSTPSSLDGDEIQQASAVNSPLLSSKNSIVNPGPRRFSNISSITTRLAKSRNSVISQAKELLGEVKRTKVIAVIVLINALCWLPLIFMNFADATGHRFLVTHPLMLTSDFLFLMNSLLMPYIYAFCKHDFKDVCRKWFCSKRKSTW